MVDHFNAKPLSGPFPCARDPEGPTNFFLRRIARNPLISLDSDERIQGNPSFSNP